MIGFDPVMVPPMFADRNGDIISTPRVSIRDTISRAANDYIRQRIDAAFIRQVGVGVGMDLPDISTSNTFAPNFAPAPREMYTSRASTAGFIFNDPIIRDGIGGIVSSNLDELLTEIQELEKLDIVGEI